MTGAPARPIRAEFDGPDRRIEFKFDAVDSRLDRSELRRRDLLRRRVGWQRNRHLQYF